MPLLPVQPNRPPIDRESGVQLHQVFAAVLRRIDQIERMGTISSGMPVLNTTYNLAGNFPVGFVVIDKATGQLTRTNGTSWVVIG